MNLIYYRGLNCHLASVINIAAALGVQYQRAFGTLWSETDFAEDPKYHIYLSKRIFPNLEALGVKMEVLPCATVNEAQESFALIAEGELFLVGMDTAHIPWNPFYKNFHEPHYFFAQKETPDLLLCFDPTYHIENGRLSHGDAVPYVFDLSRIRRLEISPPPFSVAQEARNILCGHPETQENLRMRIDLCKNKEQKNSTLLIKQINAMINNRYLFQQFLFQYPFAFNQGQRFFNRDFFSKWEAVKNGLYKTSIIKKNEHVVDEVCDLFMDVMREEMDMAKEMLQQR